MSKKVLILTPLSLTLIGLIIFIPPTNIYIISLFIFFMTFTLFTLISLFLSRMDSLFAALFILLFFAVNSAVGFNLINMILLLSFVLGVRFLIQ
ncbi:hypothetical protein HZC27_06040 [Candidatus Roizmanbacteria bacterium]|nr:hypothetical protein [Candidatus Roizmanbacteria bacterium]